MLRLAALAMAICGAVASAQAAPLPYSFSTGVAQPSAAAFGVSGGVVGSSDFTRAANLAAMVQGSRIAGSFDFDSEAPVLQTNPDGSIIYAANPGSPFTNFSASLTGGSLPGYTFSDPRGFATVGNDTLRFQAPCAGCPLPPGVDVFQLTADSQSPSGPNRNISGFSLGDFTLYNVRLFWIESQSVPELIPDFLDSNALLSAPPPFHGRMALDFIVGGDATRQYAVFFDSVSVAAPIPEPETYAMFLAGLAYLGFQARRRKAKAGIR